RPLEESPRRARCESRNSGRAHLANTLYIIYTNPSLDPRLRTIHWGQNPTMTIRALMLVFASLACASTAFAAAPPSQPTTGPGGAEIAYQAVVETRVDDPASSYWVFSPDKPIAADTALAPLPL